MLWANPQNWLLMHSKFLISYVPAKAHWFYLMQATQLKRAPTGSTVLRRITTLCSHSQIPVKSSTTTQPALTRSQLVTRMARVLTANNCWFYFHHIAEERRYGRIYECTSILHHYKTHYREDIHRILQNITHGLFKIHSCPNILA